MQRSNLIDSVTYFWLLNNPFWIRLILRNKCNLLCLLTVCQKHKHPLFDFYGSKCFQQQLSWKGNTTLLGKIWWRFLNFSNGKKVSFSLSTFGQKILKILQKFSNKRRTLSKNITFFRAFLLFSVLFLYFQTCPGTLLIGWCQDPLHCLQYWKQIGSLFPNTDILYLYSSSFWQSVFGWPYLRWSQTTLDGQTFHHLS